MTDFYQYVDGEIEKALPAACKRISPDKLLGEAPINIRYAFFSSGKTGRSKLINVLVLHPDLDIDDDSLTARLIQLRDYILSKDCMLVVIYPEENKKYIDDLGVFIDEELSSGGPNFLLIRCIAELSYRAEIEYERFDTIQGIISDLWEEKLRYKGPVLGRQHVNIELITDSCWKCGVDMYTVSGIVFPDKQLTRWDNDYWRYYNRLIQLSELEGKVSEALTGFIENLRKNSVEGRPITPLGFQYSKTVSETYFAASCPHCGALRGNFYVSELRLDYLHSLESRTNGELRYHQVELDIDQNIINSLNEGGEYCDHTCEMGWSLY